MKKFYSFKKIILAFFLVGTSLGAWAQTTYDWQTTAPDGNWQQGTASGPRWNPGGLWDAPPSLPETRLRFNNNTFVTMTNNVAAGYTISHLIFGSSATTARTIGGNAVQFIEFGAAWPRIENLSTTLHTINFPFTSTNNTGFNMELVASSGNMNFGGTLNNNGRDVRIYGNNSAVDGTNRAIRLSGIVSGSGVLNVTLFGVVKLNAAHTYTGQTTIDNGELWVESSGSIAAGSGIFVGNGIQLTNVAKLWLSNTAGATTFSNNFTINNGNSTTREIGGLNTSGTHIFSGNVTNNSTTGGLLLSTINAGGSVTFSGILSGGGAYTSQGTGTITLSGAAANTYTGTTTANGALLVLNKTAGIVAIPTATTIATGATIRTDAANQWGTGTVPLITLNGTAILNINGNNQKVALASASSTASVTLGSGTLNIDNTGTDTYAGTISGTGSLSKTNTGIEILQNSANSFTGTTTITGGELRLNPSANATYASQVVLSGGTLGTTGITASRTWTSSSTLNVTANSTIALLSGTAHTVTFAASNAVSWTAGATISVTGWSGLYNGTAGTGGRIFVGNSAAGLTTGQLAQIYFINAGASHTATLLSTGELVPTANIALFWAGPTNLWTASTWGLLPAGPYISPWTAGRTAVFNVAASAITYITNTHVGGIIANETVTYTPAGTFNTSGTVISIFVATGRTLDLANQLISSAVGTGIIKNGAGILNIGTAGGSTIPGGFTINAGIVAVGGVNGMGTGVLTINGGTIVNNSATGRIPANSSIVVNGDFQFGDAVNFPAGTGFLTFTGTVALGSSVTRTITLGNTSNQTFSGIVSGTSSNLVLAASAAGTLSLGAANTYGGNTSINGGTLALTVANALPNTTGLSLANTAGAILSIGATSQTVASISGGGSIGGNISFSGAGTLTANQTSNTTYAGLISGAGAIVKSGAGILTLGHTANTYTGTTTITAGELRLNPSTTTASYASQVRMNGGILSSTGITAATTFTSSSTLQLVASSSINLNNNVHTLVFANSSAISWTAAQVLTINGWTGVGGASGTAGRIFVGTASTHLTAGQLAQIVFTGYTGTPILLSTGELVPPVSVNYTWNGTSSNVWSTVTNWTPNGNPGLNDVVTINIPGTNTLDVTAAQTVFNFTLSGTGTFTVAAAGALTISNTLTNSSSATPTFNCGATFTLSGNAQTVPAWNYGNLVLNGATATLASSGTIGICGNYTPSATTTATGSTVNFNGTTAQSILTNAATFNNLTISNTTTTVSSALNVTVNGTGTLPASTVFIQSAGTFAANAVATTVNGIFRTTTTGAITGSAANLIFGATGTYDHNRNGGIIPTATWNDGSTCLVSGTLATAPTGAGQNFWNFTWACAGMSGTTGLTATNNPTRIRNRFLISNTNGQIFDFAGVNRNWTSTTGDLGNMEITGNSRVWLLRGPVSTSALTVRNLDVTSTTTLQAIQLNNSSISPASSSLTVIGNVTLNCTSGNAIVWGNIPTMANTFSVGGDFTHLAGGLVAGTAVTNRLRFINAGTKNFSSFNNLTVTLTSVELDGGVLVLNSNINPTAPINVNSGAIIQFNATNIAANTGTFTLASGASVTTANTAGLATTGATGSVQSTLARTFNVGGNYTFNGAAAQITGTGFTGAATLTINNTSGVALTSAATVSTALTLTNGKLDIGANGLTVSASGVSAISGASSANYIINSGAGQLIRAIATGANNYNFPVGDATNYTPAALNFSANSVARNIGVRVINTAHPSNSPSTDFANRHWALSNSNAAGTFAYTPTYTIVDAGDLGAGAFANMKINRWNGSAWAQYDATPNTTFSTPNFTLSADLSQATIVNAATNEFAIRLNPPSINYVWNGVTDATWATTTNWTPNGTPGSGDNITIPDVGSYTNELVLTGSQTVNDFVVSANGKYTLGASSALTIAGNYTYSSSTAPTFNCSSTLTISSTSSQNILAHSYGSLNLTGGDRVLANSGTIGICGTYTPGAGTITIIGSTIDFNGTGAQTINAITYNNLTISNNRGAAALTLPAGTITINGTFTAGVSNYTNNFAGNTITYNGAAAQGIAAFNHNNISSINNSRVLASSGTIGIAGTFTPGSGTYTTTTSTVAFNGDVNQTIPVLTSANYNNVIINATSTTFTKSITATQTFSGNLTINGGTFVQNTNTTFTLTITGNLTINLGTYQQSSTSGNTTLNITGNLNQNGGLFLQTAATSYINIQTNLTGDFNQTAGQWNFNNNASVSAVTGFFTIFGNYTATGGTIVTTGGAITLKGSLTMNNTSPRTYSRTGGGNLYVIFVKTGTGTLTLNSNLTVQDGRFAIAANSIVDAGLFTITSNNTDGNNTAENFTINSTGTFITSHAGGIAGAVTLSGSPLPTWAINTGSYLSYTGTAQSTGLTGTGVSTIDRLNWLGTTSLTLDAALTVTSQFNFTNNGLFILGNNNLILPTANALNGGPFTVSKMFVTNGTGELRKAFTATATFEWPIGDNTGTVEYSPANLTINPGLGGTVGLRVINGTHPNMSPATVYLNRYWRTTMTSTSYSWTGTFGYNAADVVVGPETALKLNIYDPNSPSSGWTEYSSSSAASNVLTVTSGPGTGSLNATDIAGRVDIPLYYQSTGAGGPWATIANWEVSSDPAFISPAASPASVAPNNVNNAGIFIRSASPITVGSTVWADDITIDASATLTVGASGNLTVANGAAATDFTINGTFNVNNTTTIQTGSSSILNGNWTTTVASQSTLGTAVVNGTGVYNHAFDGGTVPTATWNSGALLRITAMDISSTIGGMNQTFHHIEYNCPTQLTSTVQLGGAITAVNGNFDLVSSGTRELRFFANNPASNINQTLTISGNVNVQGRFAVTNSTSSSTAIPVLTITGDLNISGSGIFDLTGTSVNTATSSTVNLSGSLNITGSGTIVRTQAVTSTFRFNKASGSQTYTATTPATAISTNNIIWSIGNGTTQPVLNLASNFAINSVSAVTIQNLARMNCAANTVSGNIFTMISGATLGIGSVNGIVNAPAASGNIQTTTRNYTASGNGSFYYMASANQFTGNGLPTTIGVLGIETTSGARVTFNAAAPATYSLSTRLDLISGLLLLTNCNVDLAASATIGGSPWSAANMVAFNPTGTRFQGALRKLFPPQPYTLPSPFTYPVGDVSGTVEYSPITINTMTYSGGTAEPRYLGIKAINTKQPFDPSLTDFLNRNWQSHANWYGSTGTISFTANYLAADIIGTEANIRANVFDYSNGNFFEDATSTAGSNQLVSSALALTNFNDDDLLGRRFVPMYFQSNVSTGIWELASSWLVSPDPAFLSPTGVVPSTLPLAGNSEGIRILNGHNIIFNSPFTSPVTADQAIINVGGTLTMNTSSALYLMNGIGTDLEVNGNLVLLGGNSFIGQNPTYTSSSTLIYSTGTNNLGNEWTGNGTTPGYGIPNDVNVLSGTVNTPNTNRGLARDLTITSGTLNLNGTSGDLYVGRNWNRVSSATFNGNNRAVFFNGSGAQSITVTGGGTQSFPYLNITKPSGTLTINSSPATDVSVTASTGSIFGMNSTASIDLNGRTLSFTGTGGNINANGGAVTIAGTSGGNFAISGGTKTITQTGGGSFVFDNNILVILSNGINFGSGLSTVNGTLRMATGGFVTGNAPFYGSASTLQYFCGCVYGRGLEWSATSGAGYPNNVLISRNGTNTDLDLNNASSATRQIAGNLTVENGGQLAMNNMSNPLIVLGNVNVGEASNPNGVALVLGNNPGGDLQVGGNLLINTGAVFTQNTREVEMIGSASQTIANVVSFNFLKISNIGSSVSILNNTAIINRLWLNSGTLDLNGFNINLFNASQIRRSQSSATMNANPTIGLGLVYDLRYDASMTSANEYIASATQVRDVEINSGTLTINANRVFNRDLILNSSNLDLNGFVMTARGRALAPAFSGSINVSGGGTRSITGSAGSRFDFIGLGANNPLDYTKTVSTFGGTLLSFDSNVIVRIGDGSVDFGIGSPTTINGTLQVLLGGSVGQILNPCFYGVNSILNFANTVDYQVGLNDKTWATGSISSGNPGIPFNVEVFDLGTDLTLDNTRALRGNLTINNGTFTITTNHTGSFNLGGNWTRTGASSNFTHNNRLIVFDGLITGNQFITVGSGVSAETFYDLQISPASGILTLGANTNVNVLNNLNFTSSKLDLASSTNTLRIGNASANGTITGYDVNRYIISNGGKLRLSTNSNGNYIFPIGDPTDYTRYEVNLTAGATTGAFIDGTVFTGIHPNFVPMPLSYINRYWRIVPTGLTTLPAPAYSARYFYTAADIIGSGVIKAVKYSSTNPTPGWLEGPPNSGGGPANGVEGSSTSNNTVSREFEWNGLQTFSDFTGAGDGGPLPITLIAFNAQPVNNTDVLTTWTTASEINNHYFTIYRSKDAVNYDEVGRVDGSGNSNEVRSYQLIDNQPYSGISYYKLRQTDFNGDFEEFAPVAVLLSNSHVISANVFPNPSSDLVSVSLNSKMVDQGLIQIFDVAGALVWQQNIQTKDGANLFQFDVSSLAVGKYIISVKLNKDYVGNLPLIINR